VTELSELVGQGRTSRVYAYGRDSVVKVVDHGVPDAWPELEAELTRSVWAMGVPAPQVRDVVSIQGRPSVVFEWVAGPSMWQQMVAEPDRAPDLARDLAAIQKTLLQIGIPPGIPDLVDRLLRKIELATVLPENERAEAAALTAALPRGAALLHGDLHPGNILMGPQGPVVIDWFDATIGHPVADLVRSSLLMQPGTSAPPRHLPGATKRVLQLVQQAYLREFHEELQVAESDLARWRGVVAAGRLAEHAETDATALLDLWAARSDDQEAKLALLS